VTLLLTLQWWRSSKAASSDAHCLVLRDHFFVATLRVISMQSYRKTVTAARKDKKAGRPPGLTEEQKQEIRYILIAQHAQRAAMQSLASVNTRHVVWPCDHCTARNLYVLLCPEAVDSLITHREAFDLFDTDGSGTIDAKELKVAMRYV
jgi:centrin-1